MRILFYFNGINRSSGGIYQYGIALLNILANDATHDYFLYCTPDSEIDKIINGKKNFAYLPPTKQKKFYWKRIVKRYINKFAKALGISFRLKVLTPFDASLSEWKIDIVYSPFQSIPATQITTIATLHDVQELHHPEFFSSAARAERAVKHKNTIDRASAIVVSYQHIKDDIVRFFNKPEGLVFVILLDMKNLWFNNLSADSNVESKSVAFDQFVLYPAATWPHKNHYKLLEAIAILKNRGITVNLICTGHLTDHFEKIKIAIAELGIGDRVSFLGVVDDETLLWLYKKALGVVVPTLYEAGSFPLMEALMLSVPVICSNVTSLPETIGDPTFVFDPNSSNAIAEKLELLTSSEDFRQQNLENGRIQALKLKNTSALTKIMAVIEVLRQRVNVE